MRTHTIPSRPNAGGASTLSIRDPSAYADCLGIPRSISRPIIHLVEKWVRCSGVEWTVTRCKNIKTDFIKSRAGYAISTAWVKKKHGGLTGPYAGLERWSLKSSKRWQNAIQFLQIATNFISNTLTPTQEKKFISGVTAEPPKICCRVVAALEESARIVVKRRYLYREPSPLVLRPVSAMKREPHASGRTFNEGTSTLLCAHSFLRGTMIGNKLNRKYRSVFSEVMKYTSFTDSRDSDYESTVVAEHYNVVGRISFIQEPGFKLRAVANPARVYQQALKPLGDDLFDVLRDLPWDCTHNQRKADEAITNALSCGRTVYSIDLTGATDYFPLELQMAVLRKVYGKDNIYVNLFEDISKASWLYKSDSVIRWNRGQPLGLYPSFAAFALTHGLLLESLNCGHRDSFFVLGDDVVILSEQLYHDYIQVLSELGCPISESKSITSDRVAEFGGHVFTADRHFPQLKWRCPSDDNFLDLLRNIGPRGFPLLRRKQRKIAKMVQDIPEFLGGLGFNPLGIPLNDRVEKYYTLFGDDSNTYLMSYNEHINRLNYDGNVPPYLDIQIDKCDLDQKSLAYVHILIPTLVKWYRVCGGNLYSLNQQLPLVLETSGSRLSMLELLDRKLK